MSKMQQRLNLIPEQASLKVPIPDQPQEQKISYRSARVRSILIGTLLATVSLGAVFALMFKKNIEEKALPAVPVDALTAQNSEAIKFYLAHDAAKAVQILGELTKTHPENAILFSNLGAAQLFLKDFEAVEVALLKAQELEAAPTAKTLGNLGSLYAEKNDFKKADEYFKKALELSPTDSAILLNLAILKEKQLEWQAAIDVYQIYLLNGHGFENLKSSVKEHLRFVRSLAHYNSNYKDARHAVQ